MTHALGRPAAPRRAAKTCIALALATAARHSHVFAPKAFFEPFFSSCLSSLACFALLAALHVRAALLAVSVVPAKLSTFPCVLFHLLFNPSTYLFRLLAFTSSTSSFPSPPPQSLLINFFLYSSFTSLPPISSFPLAFPPFISTSPSFPLIPPPHRPPRASSVGAPRLASLRRARLTPLH